MSVFDYQNMTIVINTIEAQAQDDVIRSAFDTQEGTESKAMYSSATTTIQHS